MWIQGSIPCNIFFQYAQILAVQAIPFLKQRVIYYFVPVTKITALNKVGAIY